MPIKDLARSKDQPRRIRFWAIREQDLHGNLCNCPSINRREQKKIVSLFSRYYLTTGYFSGKFPENTEKFKKIEDALYEIKPSKDLRLLGFFDGADFIIVLCVRKQKSKLDQKDIDKAQSYIVDCKKEIENGKRA